MANQYDLVIVGGGYSGLMAAKTAGELGLKTVLIEMKHDISKPNRVDCQTLLPMAEGEGYLEEVVNLDPETGVIKFVKNDVSFKSGSPYRNVYGFELDSIDGQTLKFGDPNVQRKLGDKGRICVALDKSKVLASLLQQAKAAGAEVITGTVVTGVSKTDEGVKLTTNKGKEFTATFAIAADGANSKMTQQLGLNKDRGYYSSMTVLGYYAEDLKLPDPEVIYYAVARYEGAGVITAIGPRPYDNKNVVVFICVDCRVDLLKYKEYFTKDTKLSSWFEGAKLELVNSSCGNMWSTLEKPYKDNVLLVGDTCWCQESENFGALLSGALASRAVKEAIKNNNPTEEGIKSYLDFWDKCFFNNPKYQRDQLMGNYLLGTILNNEEISFLFSKLNTVLPASIHPYTLFADLGEEIGKVAGDIQGEMPSVLAGLGRLQQESPAEILKDAAAAGFPNR